MMMSLLSKAAPTAVSQPHRNPHVQSILPLQFQFYPFYETFHQVTKSQGLLFAVKSSKTISSSVDRAMDKEVPSKGHLDAGISLRMGPVQEMDVDDTPAVNGYANGKRKSRGSIGGQKKYKEASSSDDETPLVRGYPSVGYFCSDRLIEQTPQDASRR
jgi:hypothetical protein